VNAIKPAKFTVQWSDDEPIAALGDTPLDVEDVHDKTVIVECDAPLLESATFAEFPPGLRVRMHSSDGWGTYLFHEATVYRDHDERLVSCHICHQPNKYWEGKWGLATFLRAIADQTKYFPEIRVGETEFEDDWKRLELLAPLDNGPAASSIRKNAEAVKAIMASAEVALGGIQWKEEYDRDERAFCLEVLAPLLRRMGFLAIHYTQGAREYGKDFTFSELSPFGHLRHYGLQAKAGNVSGEVNSAIDELVGQADDAFRMPYYDIASTEPRFISTFVVAISGRFTANAKDKIVNKIPRGQHGSLLFLDRETVMELLNRYWSTS
jgi:hypothetical protein